MIKKIFLKIQQRLSEEVESLRYIDKNWNQLNEAQPPVQWPCCLIDLEQVDYSKIAGRGRMAAAVITLTVADSHAVRSSANAPQKCGAYGILDVVEAIAGSLEGWRVPHTTQGLELTRLEKAYTDRSYDVYAMRFTAAWVEEGTEEGVTMTATPPIRIVTDDRPVTPSAPDPGQQGASAPGSQQ